MPCFRVVRMGGLLLLLAGAACGADIPMPRTDRYGDPLPPGAVMRLGTIRLRHRDAQVVFSKDGKQLISCDEQRKVRVWDAATGKRLNETQLPWSRKMEHLLFLLLLSPDGTTAAGLDEHALTIWKLPTAKEHGRIPSPPGQVRGFGVVDSHPGLSPDGKFLAFLSAVEKNKFTVEIWDTVTLKKRRTLSGDLAVYRSSLAFSADGKRLAAVVEHDDGADVFLWDTTTGKLLARQKKLTGIDVECLAFSADGKTLALGGQKDVAVRLLATDTLQEKRRLKAPAGIAIDYVRGLAFSPDGRRLAAAWEEIKADNKEERGIFVWELEGEKQPRGLPGCLDFIGFAPDGKTLACCNQGEIRLYNAATGRPLHDRPGHELWELALALSADGKMLASGDRDGVVYLWDTATGKSLRRLHAAGLHIAACLLSADGKYVVAVGKTGAEAERFAFQTWAIADGKVLRRAETGEGEEVSLYAAELSADGKRLLTVLGKTRDSRANLVIWDLLSGKRLSERVYQLQIRPGDGNKHPPTPESYAAFASGGELLSVWLGDRIGLEEVATGSLLATLPKGTTRSVFSPDSRLVAAPVWRFNKNTQDIEEWQGLALIETASGEELFRLAKEAVDFVSFTPDGRGLIAADLENLYVWDTDTGEKHCQRARPSGIERIAFEASELSLFSTPALPGDRLAAAMPDGDILLWDISAAKPSKPKRDLGSEELARLWTDLAGEARKAYRAVGTLAAAPAQTIPFLKDHLRPITVDGKRIKQLLADLDSDAFETREAAARELTKMHYRIEPLLRRALEGKPSLEMRRRLQAILAEPKRPQPEDLRLLRAIAVLERIATPEARIILEKLSGGAASPEKHAAQTARQRLKNRDVSVKERALP